MTTKTIDETIGYWRYVYQTKPEHVLRIVCDAMFISREMAIALMQCQITVLEALQLDDNP